MKKERIYLDYAASTPLDPRALKAMLPYLKGEFGNPGSLHSFGQAAIKAVDGSREKIARYLGVGFREVVFTGSATEANNLALRGAVALFRSKFPDRRPKIIISAVEHESVMETAKALVKEGADLELLPVDKQGVVSIEALKKSLGEEVAIVSVMYGNNETGSIQPVRRLSDMIQEFRASLPAKAQFPLFHTDASQALAWLSCRPSELGVDLMTISGHKIYGPKGVGALYIRQKDTRDPINSFHPTMTGGGQEFGLRSSTENVAAIAGFGRAVELLDIQRDSANVQKLKDRFLRKIKAAFPALRSNSPEGGLPHILNLRFPGREAEDMLIRLDMAGVAVSSGSACRSRGYEPSYVLFAMGLTSRAVEESLRVSFGRTTTTEEVDSAVRAIKRAFTPLGKM